jgi:hypothetical protein
VDVLIQRKQTLKGLVTRLQLRRGDGWPARWAEHRAGLRPMVGDGSLVTHFWGETCGGLKPSAEMRETWVKAWNIDSIHMGHAKPPHYSSKCAHPQTEADALAYQAAGRTKTDRVVRPGSRLPVQAYFIWSTGGTDRD